MNEYKNSECKKWIHQSVMIGERGRGSAAHATIIIQLLTSGSRKLMDCFNQPMVEAPEFPELTRRCQEIKSKGEINMCDKVEQFAKEYAKEYIKEYVEEYVEVQQIKTILNLDKAGVSVDIIASSTNKSVEEIETILNLHKDGTDIDTIVKWNCNIL